MNHKNSKQKTDIYSMHETITLNFLLDNGRVILKTVEPKDLESRTDELEMFMQKLPDVYVNKKLPDIGSMLYHYKRESLSVIKQENGKRRIELVYRKKI